MSGDPESGDGDASRPRASLFGRATKPTLNDPAPPPAQPPRKPRRMGLSSLSGLLTFVLLGALATVGGLVWLMKEARSPGPLTEDKVVMIMRENDAADIADQLERAGVIDSATWFNILTALDGNRGALKRGEYAFKAGMSMNDIENELIAHHVIRYKITIPEGLTSEQVVDRLHEDSVLTGDIREPPREGSLMPDTYYFERGDTRLSILSRMAKTQTKAVEDIWKTRSPDLPIKSPWEMVTLASIVEKETGKPEERPRVAGVFINRLDKHMRLGSDPTIVYGLVQGKGTLGRSITKADLNQSTPYNTYLIDGLPPGPICNPGKAALEAVAKPARSKDLYFVADGTGGHAFAETLDQHQKNVAHWRQIEKDV
ncbi:MAG TPA: endolytic transglycosylase MltG, partial [Roseiarcus sp.]|nr:endolytic transglycosylase MltG [Roseiarcus sp.]